MWLSVFTRFLCCLHNLKVGSLLYPFIFFCILYICRIYCTYMLYTNIPCKHIYIYSIYTIYVYMYKVYCTLYMYCDPFYVTYNLYHIFYFVMFFFYLFLFSLYLLCCSINLFYFLWFFNLLSFKAKPLALSNFQRLFDVRL